jgi:hypothetical protein
VAQLAVCRRFIFSDFAEEQRQDSPKAVFIGLKSTSRKRAPVAQNIQTVTDRREIAVRIDAKQEKH